VNGRRGERGLVGRKWAVKGGGIGGGTGGEADFVPKE